MPTKFLSSKTLHKRFFFFLLFEPKVTGIQNFKARGHRALVFLKMRKFRQGMVKITSPGCPCELSSPYTIQPLNETKILPKINFRRENILFLYLKNYQVFFKEASKIFGKRGECMLQYSNITIDTFKRILTY